MRKPNRWKAPAMGLALATCGLVAHAAFAAIQPEAGIGLPRDVSLDGWRIDKAMNITHVVNIVFFGIMCGWMAWSIFKHNGKKHEAVYDHGESKKPALIAVFVAALVLSDVELFYSSIKGLDEAFWNWDIPNKNEKTVRIEINAHQWAWDGRYAGPDKKFSTPLEPSEDDVITWNEFTVPVNTPVHLQITSTDVIHAFYLPNFRVKIDAMPGMLNQLWFQATQTGEFEIGCAQHCGTNHYKMRGKLNVVTEEEYQRWLTEASTIAKSAYDPDDASARWGWKWKE